ncbi:acyl-CoA dehydrogenase family protein [Pseudonocardia endophytica]|uniref:Alkylation response protein AidB-like acyl-CoA dehydrogenase n=1 Tax=Pseudonocardia endophytica TaxID=401976 RepID=A0A4R1HWJ8_PSEEN|nr:acyl-CoA dehydrogenase family protein [Pseudonocardia endophytica]TCK26718.1 alkylation response protein AidB-like acyl-CoA dehydrogenase [Pseudonocardia endophytica]
MTDILDRPQATGAGTAPDHDVIARATALVPLIREHAVKSSEERRVVPEVVDALEEAGLFKLLVPRRLGGLETNLRTMMECVAEVGRGDGSTAWAVALLNVCTWFSTTFSDEAQEEMFSTPNTKACGIFSPPLKSERVEGGYLVSGRWAYSSGSFAATWATLGIGVEGDDPRALALIPASAWTIEPTWFVAGMKGSGSDTIVVEDHFVPDHRIQRFADMVEGAFRTSHKPDEQNANMAFIPVAAVILVGAQIGLARHAMERTLSKLPPKNVAYTCYTNARNSPTHQVGVAEASSLFDQAEMLLQRACADVDDAAARGVQLDRLTRARVRMDTGMIGQLVKEGVDKLMTANGASSFADANVLSMVWRDSEIAGRHALVMPELGKEAYGRLLLGADEPLTIDV